MPIDASIALQTRLPEIDSPLNALAKASQVKNAMNQNRLFDMKVAADQRQQEKQNALMQVNRDSIDPVTGLMDTNKRRQGLARLGDYDALQAFEKDQADLLKTSADTGKVKADTGKTEWETQKDKAEFSVNRISGLLTKPVITDSDIATISQEFMSYPGSDALQVLKMVASLPPESDQAGRRTAIEAMRMGNMKALDQLKYTRPDADTIATNQTSRANNAASVAATVRGQDMAEGRANNGTYDPARGVIVGRDGTARPVVGPDGAPIGPKSSTANMSSTMQKELFEADDSVQSSQNVIGLLTTAIGLNKKAYSGLGAAQRAAVRGQLPGDTSDADATIDLDNIMTGQALESLKSVFGGMPTEGERKILMDMQASADKTPAQRESIMNRAIAAADRRLKFNSAKAKALRDGTYTTGGFTPPARTDEPAAPPQIKTDADYSALPSGAEFIDPNGKRRRKP